ncbi:MAG TPA: hypothetical protein VIG82_05860 [Enteractinococcus sp.]
MVDQQQEARLQVVEAPEDCGNAPRKIVIRDFLIALYQQDEDHVLEALAEDIRWELVGSRVLNGLEEVREWLRREPPVRELHIAMVITHGTDCGVDGWVVYADGRTRALSHVLIFAGHAKSAKIKALRSYLIDISG